MKIYLKSQKKEKVWFERQVDYFVRYFKQKNIGDRDHHDLVDLEIDNIIPVFKYCYSNNKTNELLTMWNYLGVFLWESGRWIELEKLGEIRNRINIKKFNNYIIIAAIIFCFFTIWQIISLMLIPSNSFYKILYSYCYYVQALFGFYCGFRIARKWGLTGSLIGKSMYFFAAGLLFQSFGQVGYSFVSTFRSFYYYPSIGDYGYFGSIFLYLYGMIMLNKASGVKIKSTLSRYKILSVSIAVFLLSTTYAIFFYDYGFEKFDVLRIFLDLGYPLFQSISLSFAILALLNSWKIPIDVLRKRLRFFLLALFCQYLADFTFLYLAKTNNIFPGDFFEFLYLLSYFLMTLAILQFRTFYSGEETKKLPAVS